uniref:hypothetical protein n=1 Tax=Oceaniglobus roseus TaxID=1737570 RepID=UPI0013001684
ARGPRREAEGGGRNGGPRGRRDGAKDASRGERKFDGKPKGNRGKGGARNDDAKGKGAKSFEARPPRREKQIDPDNPFAAALMGFKDKT